MSREICSTVDYLENGVADVLVYGVADVLFRYHERKCMQHFLTTLLTSFVDDL